MIYTKNKNQKKTGENTRNSQTNSIRETNGSCVLSTTSVLITFFLSYLFFFFFFSFSGNETIAHCTGQNETWTSLIFPGRITSTISARLRNCSPLYLHFRHEASNRQH